MGLFNYLLRNLGRHPGRVIHQQIVDHFLKKCFRFIRLDSLCFLGLWGRHVRCKVGERSDTLLGGRLEERMRLAVDRDALRS